MPDHPLPKLHGGDAVAAYADDLAEPDKKAVKAVENAESAPAEHEQRRVARRKS